MSSFAGRFQVIDRDSTAGQAAACRTSFDTERVTITPPVGSPLGFDLGDIDGFHPADYELRLDLYTGQTIVLAQFGKAFQNLCHDLLAAWRDRVVHCLLLEDLEELVRVEGFAALDSAERRLAQPAELRLHRSNLAVLPVSATGFQWRLADIDAVDFDAREYALTIRSGEDRLVVSKLARRTDEFRNRLNDAMTELSERSAAVVRHLFPFLSPLQLQRAAGVLREGRSAPLSALAGIHCRIEQALIENAIDADLRPYFQSLKELSATGDFYAGFKLIRRESDTAGGEGGHAGETAEAGGTEVSEAGDFRAPPEISEARVPAADAASEEVLHWFFFRLRAGFAAADPADVLAWEATSRSGRATYCFRMPPSEDAARSQGASQDSLRVDAAVRRLNRGVALLNFRREPIYLPDESLELQPRFRRYAIASRKIPVLRELRNQYLGRAIHTTPEAWKKQLQALMAKA
jgi:hypothetical protein